MPEIRFENVCKEFAGHGKALGDGSFLFPDKKITALLGPSAAGKSTTLRLIAGLEQPTSGQLFFDDRPVRHVPPHKRSVGMVFPNPALFGFLTAEENARLAGPIQKVSGQVSAVSKDRELDDFQQLAAALEIGDAIGKYPHQMSSGEQQRVALLIAVLSNPEILLLDEPFRHLDLPVKQRLLTWMRQLQNASPKTVILVTHDPNEIISFADHVKVMCAGKIVQEGHPEELWQSPKHLFIARAIYFPIGNEFSGKFYSNGAESIFSNAFLKLALPLVASDGRIIEDLDIVMVCDPKSLTISSPNALDSNKTVSLGRNWIVTTVIHYPHSTLISLKHNGVDLRVELPDSSPGLDNLGSKCSVSLDVGRCHFFDSNTGLALTTNRIS